MKQYTILQTLGRILLLISLISLASCASLSAVGTASSSAMDGVMYIFQGEEVSIPLNTKATLVSCQRGLRRVGLNVDILEKRDDGYSLQFANEKLKGKLDIHYETTRLNTIFVQVWSGVIRNKSVEKAILEVINKASKSVSAKSRLSLKGYIHVYAEANHKVKRIAWFRRGADIRHRKAMADPGWLRIQLPSKRKGFIRAKTARI